MSKLHFLLTTALPNYLTRVEVRAKIGLLYGRVAQW